MAAEGWMGDYKGRGRDLGGEVRSGKAAVCRVN